MPKMEPKSEEKHVPREIPLEQIDLIDFPRDPRKPIQEDYFHDENDDDLVLPRFWRETVLKIAIEKNQQRNPHLDGSYRRSNSYVRERALQRTQRLATAPRTDPRIDRSFFPTGPRKIITPPKKHNMSQPNIKPASIFECEDTENISSSEFSSSSSESFNSISPGENGQTNGHNSTKVNDDVSLDSVSGSDNDCSFSTFQKRKMITRSTRSAKRVKHLESKSNDVEKVPPIRIDLKRKQVTSAKKKKSLSKYTFSIGLRTTFLDNKMTKK